MENESLRRLALAEMRREYTTRGLHRDDLDPDPINQFRKWFADAEIAGIVEPNAMTLATAGRDGDVSARTVLLKECHEGGFVFFTNFGSRKGADLAENPRAALVFPWVPLERQVAVSGKAERVSRDESRAYFDQRPLASRIGAWASPQSQPVPSRAFLEQRFENFREKYASGEVPLPENWGGYRVVPESIEFWQGSASRLHDRFLYRRLPEGGWSIERLAP